LFGQRSEVLVQCRSAFDGVDVEEVFGAVELRFDDL